MTTAETTQHVYDHFATEFDQKRGKSLFEKAWLDRFLAFVPSGGHVLDVGCGSGDPIAAYLMGKGFQVTGIDASPAMIDLARSKYPGSKWAVQDMRTLSASDQWDGVIAWNSFFHLTRPDQRKVLPKLANLVKPGGPLMITTGTGDGEALGQVAGQPVYHASLTTESYTDILEHNGCTVQRVTLTDPDCQQHSVLLAQKTDD